MTIKRDTTLTTAQETFDTAKRELNRAQVLADLRTKPGLRLAIVSGTSQQTMIVTYDGDPLGTVHTTTSGYLHDWYARPSDGSPHGPYLTARAAAASLIADDPRTHRSVTPMRTTR